MRLFIVSFPGQGKVFGAREGDRSLSRGRGPGGTRRCRIELLGSTVPSQVIAAKNICKYKRTPAACQNGKLLPLGRPGAPFFCLFTSLAAPSCH